MTHPALPEPELKLGKYHIVRPLKVGGTAAIYLAVLRGENNFSREVVIKRPLPHLVSDARARLMFIDEAHIASRLSHPNICQVLDLVSREDELYLVLEYLKGLDLREVLKRCMELGRLMPPEIAVWIGIEVCAGLDFAHEAVAIDGTSLGLIHRDVSPKNIRITDSGSVKVIDFGIARAMNRATETAVGTIKGTLGYMSPEQILGDEIDSRSDIFAFGICLFQMLTCRNPFDGPTLKERVRRLTQAPVPSVREFNGALDEEIEGIVAKCLQRDVSERYQRMRDVQRDLDRYLSKLQGTSPRQRLIMFLEEIFPSIHETDPELKVALTEISTIAGRIDTSQRLRFPDDEGARPASVATRSTVKADSTISTIKDEGFQNTKTAPGEPARGARTTSMTPPPPTTETAAPVTAVDQTAPAHARMEPVTEEAAAAAYEQETIEAGDVSGPATAVGAKPMPWTGIGVLLALTAAVVAATVVWLSDRWSSTPLGEGAGTGTQARVDPGKAVGPPERAVERPGEHAVERPGEHAVERPGEHAVERPGEHAVERPGEHAVEHPQVPSRTSSAAAAVAASTAKALPREATAREATARESTPRDAAGRTTAPRETAVRETVVRETAVREAADGVSAEGSSSRARLYFKTAHRLEREGRSDDALLMYTLAYKESGRKVDPAIFRNLGLLHNKSGDAAKARACFRGYLDKSGTSADADRIRTLLSSFPPTKSVACVDMAELARAKKTASRNGAMIDQWVNETVAEQLR